MSFFMETNLYIYKPIYLRHLRKEISLHNMDGFMKPIFAANKHWQEE